MQHHIMHYLNGEISNSTLLNNGKWKQYHINYYNIKIVEHNIVQHFHSATLGRAAVNSATINSAPSESATKWNIKIVQHQ